MSDGRYDGSGSIIRGYPESHPFSVHIMNLPGSYPINQMTDAHMHNYEVYYVISNISLPNLTESFMSRDAEVGNMELMESQKGLNVGEKKTLRIRTPLKLNKAQCDYMAYMCLLILHHENGSYVENNSVDNIICIYMSTLKVCNPGMDTLYKISF